MSYRNESLFGRHTRVGLAVQKGRVRDSTLPYCHVACDTHSPTFVSRILLLSIPNECETTTTQTTTQI